MEHNYVTLKNFVSPNTLTNIDSVILKIKNTATNYYLKDWIEAYQVPKGIVPSNLTFGECMKIALTWREDQRLNEFPATKIAHILETHDMTVSVDKVTVMPNVEEETDEAQVFVNRQSFYVALDKKVDSHVISAQAAEYLGYLAKIDGTGSVADTFSQVTCKGLMIKYSKTTDVMNAFKEFCNNYPGGGIRSPGLIRDALYANFLAQENLGFYVWSLFNERTGCGEPDDRAAKLIESLKMENSDLPVAKGFTHTISYLSYPDCKVMDTMFKLHHNHNQARGDEKGSGALASTYYWNTFSKSMSKILFNVISIMDLCLKVNLNIVFCESGLLSDYEVNMLIANNVTVICSDFGPPCTPDSKVGKYGSTDLPYIYFTKLKGSAPKIIEKVVTAQYDVNYLVNMVPKDNNIFFMRVHMHPDLEAVVKKNNLSLVPVLNCHKPEVYVSNRSLYADITMETLIQRCVKANYYKTMFPMNKLPFGVVDSYAPDFFFKSPVYFPRRGGKQIPPVKMETIKMIEAKTKKVVAKFEIPESYEFIDSDSDEEERPQITTYDPVVESAIDRQLQMFSESDASDREMRASFLFGLIKGYLTGDKLSVPSMWLIYYQYHNLDEFRDQFSQYSVTLSRFEHLVNTPIETERKFLEQQAVKPAVPAVLKEPVQLDLGEMSLIVRKKKKRGKDDE